MTPSETSTERKYFLQWPILELGEEMQSYPPFLTFGTSAMPSSLLSRSPSFPLCLQHLPLEPNCAFLSTILPQYCNSSVFCSVFKIPKSIICLQQEVSNWRQLCNTRFTRLINMISILMYNSSTNIKKPDRA